MMMMNPESRRRYTVGVLVSTLFSSMRYSRRFALTTEEERKTL